MPAASATVVLEPVLAPDRHVSLSPPFYLQRHHIDNFGAHLRRSIRGVAPFDFTLDTAATVLCNPTATRAFLSLPVTVGLARFQALIDCVDQPLRQYQQPSFHKDRLAHVSVASSTAPQLIARKGDVVLGGELGSADAAVPPPIMRAATVCFKAGCRVFAMPLGADE